VWEYAAAAAAILTLNLLPAFGPPTWAVLVLLTVSFDLEPVILVPLGAAAAAAGRYLLARAAARWRTRMAPDRVRSLEAAGASVTANRTRALAGLGLFAISPLPSAQLFIAAGLVGVRLVPLTAAFFAGRLVAYTLYVGAAAAVESSLSEVIGQSLASPLAIALQLAMLVGLVVLLRVDWTRVLAAHRLDPPQRPGPAEPHRHPAAPPKQTTRTP
jgi:membrane protein YqaA with SNARE-associated domain